MRNIPICSVEELTTILNKNTIMSVSMVQVRNFIFNEHETVTIIDNESLENMINWKADNCVYISKNVDVKDFIQALYSCIEFGILPSQFVVYLG